MSDPKNHHWLPRFLLRKWADISTGKVMCLHRPLSRVVFSWQGIKNLGSAEWLYRASWAGYEDHNFVETSFMRNVIDMPAAQIHRRMLDGEVGALGFEERQRWAWFMLLLLQRHPDAIQPRQEAQEEGWKNFFMGTLLGQTPTGHAEPLDRAGAESFYNQNFAGSGRDLVLQALVNFPLSSPFPNQIMNLEWRVLRLDSASTCFFPLADNPVSMVGDGSNKGFWMPLAPDALFVAGDRDYFSTTPVLHEEFREILPLRVMHYQFSQAREFAIGKDAGAEKNQALVRIADRYLPRHSSIPTVY